MPKKEIIEDLFPEWLIKYQQFFGKIFQVEEIVELLLELIQKNLFYRSGGPFSAIVTDNQNRLVSLGVNSVLSSQLAVAHAEINALIFSQQRLKTYDLSEKGKFRLYSSAQPCIMCCGAIVWSGISELFFISPKSDVEAILGFDEGFLPRKWRAELKRRGIETIYLRHYRQQAAELLRQYHSQSGVIYNSQLNQIVKD